MFGSNKTKEETKSTSGSGTTNNPNALNSLVKGTFIEGNVKAENDIRIDGTLKGNLQCKAKVIIGATGFIEGEVKCANAVIEGKFKGVLLVSELLTVKENAEVTGDIRTNKLTVQPGAVFNFVCKMETEVTPNGAIKSEKDVKPVVTTAKA